MCSSDGSRIYGRTTTLLVFYQLTFQVEFYLAFWAVKWSIANRWPHSIPKDRKSVFKSMSYIKKRWKSKSLMNSSIAFTDHSGLISRRTPKSCWRNNPKQIERWQKNSCERRASLSGRLMHGLLNSLNEYSNYKILHRNQSSGDEERVGKCFTFSVGSRTCRQRPFLYGT